MDYKIVTAKVAILNDFHVPFHDKKTVNHVVNFLEYFKPNTVILNGDIIDFYSISYYEKDPRLRMNLKKEIKEVRRLFGKLVNKIDAKFYYIKGNHEERLYRYIVTRANELLWLPSLEFSQVLGLHDFGIKFVNKRYMFVNKNIMISHVDKYSRNGSARLVGKEFPGFHVIHGHSHIISYIQYYDKIYIDNGCLSLLEANYLKVPSYWGQSLTVVDKGKIQLIPIFDHKVYYGELRF